jgi:hypothetical protein
LKRSSITRDLFRNAEQPAIRRSSTYVRIMPKNAPDECELNNTPGTLITSCITSEILINFDRVSYQRSPVSVSPYKGFTRIRNFPFRFSSAGRYI